MERTCHFILIFLLVIIIFRPRGQQQTDQPHFILKINKKYLKPSPLQPPSRTGSMRVGGGRANRGGEPGEGRMTGTGGIWVVCLFFSDFRLEGRECW